MPRSLARLSHARRPLVQAPSRKAPACPGNLGREVQQDHGFKHLGRVALPALEWQCPHSKPAPAIGLEADSLTRFGVMAPECARQNRFERLIRISRRPDQVATKQLQPIPE